MAAASHVSHGHTSTPSLPRLPPPLVPAHTCGSGQRPSLAGLPAANKACDEHVPAPLLHSSVGFAAHPNLFWMEGVGHAPTALGTHATRTHLRLGGCGTGLARPLVQTTSINTQLIEIPKNTPMARCTAPEAAWVVAGTMQGKLRPLEWRLPHARRQRLRGIGC